MRYPCVPLLVDLWALLPGILAVQAAGPVIVDHRHTDIIQIPQSAIEVAKANLHIAYGHTSHGSQLTDGMSGLVAFANGGGLGLSLPDNIFEWNNGGVGGALSRPTIPTEITTGTNWSTTTATTTATATAPGTATGL